MLRKISFLFIFAFILPLYFLTPFFFSNKLQAAVFCQNGLTGINFSYDFTPPLTDDKTSIAVTINHGGKLPNGIYSVGVSNGLNYLVDYHDALDVVNSSDLVFANVSPQGGKFYSGNNILVALKEDQGNVLCSDEFSVVPSNTGPDNYCIAHLKPGNNYIAPGDVSLKVEFTRPLQPRDADGTSRHGLILTDTQGREWRQPGRYPTNEMGGPGVEIAQQLRVGAYRVQVIENYIDGPIYNLSDQGRSCFTNYFTIGNEENPGHECTSSNSAGCPSTNGELSPNAPLSLPCDKDDLSQYDTDKGCLKIHTAIGDINTQANDFVRWVLGFVLGISGGIVLIIIIITGYRLMTSQGDPEKVKNARDQLTAAIVGLLFIIFSLVILQLITKDILHLPGFGS